MMLRKSTKVANVSKNRMIVLEGDREHPMDKLAHAWIQHAHEMLLGNKDIRCQLIINKVKINHDFLDGQRNRLNLHLPW